jgi:hypothetical protein
MPPASAQDLDLHFSTVINALKDRRLIPFFGAGVNLCDRPQEVVWEETQHEYLPSGGELATYLIRQFTYPGDQPHDLLRVSQFAYAINGSGPLYEKLHHIFSADYPPSSLHRFFAELPANLSRLGYPAVDDPLRPRFLFVTTNYDNTLEAAFRAVGQAFHALTYQAEGSNRGRFLHVLPGELVSQLVDKPNEYEGFKQDRHPAILKIHGAVDRSRVENDSYVITEDHYINYLSHTEVAQLLPVVLSNQIKRSHFLFLGYSLSDWNLRAMLHRIWGDQKLSYNSWSVQLNPSNVDKKLWDKRGVEIIDLPLHDYVSELSGRLQALPSRGGAQ